VTTSTEPEPRLDSAVAIAAAIRDRRATAVDGVAAHRARHVATHRQLNALVQLRPEAEADARSIDAAALGNDAAALGPLAGVPVSVKECFPVAGLRTTLGIESRRNTVDAADAPLVARLKAAGAVIVGKANVPQAMYLHETDNPVWGRTNHPRTADRGPGGSSGGDAALVAAGVVPLAVGNDLAGSLRQPAHACGIATLMPRSAVLGDGGAFDTMPHLTVVRPRAGFLARSVADLAVATEAGGVPLAAAADVSGSGLRIGWWDDTGCVPASPAVIRGVAEAVARLRAAGATLVPLDPAIAAEAAWLHLAILAADGGRHVRALFGSSRPIPGVARLLRIAALPRSLRPLVSTVARITGRRLEAEAVVKTGPRDAAEVAALAAARIELAARFAALVATCDAIVCPVSAVPALRHGTAARLILAAAPCLLANLLDLAAGAVPVTTVRPDEETGRAPSRDPVLQAAAATDRGSRGLPIGVQVIATPNRDESTVLRVMRLIEAPGTAGIAVAT
jgi:fatty acid amide hydrolase